VGSGVVLPIAVLQVMTSTTRGCAPTGGVRQLNAWHSFEAGLDLPDPSGARGDAITTRGPSAIQGFAEVTCV